MEASRIPAIIESDYEDSRDSVSVECVVMCAYVFIVDAHTLGDVCTCSEVLDTNAHASIFFFILNRILSPYSWPPTHPSHRPHPTLHHKCHLQLQASGNCELLTPYRNSTIICQFTHISVYLYKNSHNMILTGYLFNRF